MQPRGGEMARAEDVVGALIGAIGGYLALTIIERLTRPECPSCGAAVADEAAVCSSCAAPLTSRDA